MTHYRATYSFDKLPPLEKAEFADTHAAKITGSTIFDNPPNTPVQITTASTLVKTTHAAYVLNHGDSEHTAFLTADVELSAKLKKNADYVTTVADGDKIKIESTNFVASKDKHRMVSPYSVKQSETPGAMIFHYTKEADEIGVTWLCYKGSQPPATMKEYSFLLSVTSDNIEKGGLDSASQYCFVASPIKLKKTADTKYLPPIIKTVP